MTGNIVASTNMHLTPCTFHGLEAHAEFNWAFGSGSHKPTVKVLVKAGIFSDAWGPCQSSRGCTSWWLAC